jgi:two-component system response regulator HydG
MKQAKRNVLIVDDASNWRSTLETVLTPYGFEVTMASNAVEAFHALSQRPFDAAILDVRLDSLDDTNDEGISTVLAGAHQRDPQLGFVVISSYYNENEVRSMVPPGATIVYFDKNNFRIDELINALEQLTGSKNG